MTRFWDGRTDRRTDRQTDGVTALLDLLSPSATQVKIGLFDVGRRPNEKPTAGGRFVKIIFPPFFSDIFCFHSFTALLLRLLYA